MPKPKVASLAFLVAAAALVFAAPAFAQEDISFLRKILEGGGIIGIFILLLSIAMVALIIQFSVTVRRDKICAPELIDELEALLEEDEYQEALELCESEPNFLTNSLGAGLPRIDEGFEKMKEAMENAAGVEALKLQQKVGWLLFLSNIAPMLGLFGTVSGMIQAFDKIVALGARVTPKDLAEGISVALITTLEGLFVAMPALFGYPYFRNEATRIRIDFGGILEDMTAKFRTR